MSLRFDRLGDFPAELFVVDPELAKHPCCDPVAFTEAEEEVLRTDETALEAARFGLGVHDDDTSSIGESFEHDVTVKPLSRQ